MSLNERSFASKVINRTLLVALLLLIGCKHQISDHTCECTDINGAIIIDTSFHTTQDEAYQLCKGLEYDAGVKVCQSFE